MPKENSGLESGRTVTRADLSEIVYQRVGLSRSESAELVQSVLDEICDAAARGETVKLSGFGSFVVRSKGERIGRNPKTGVEVPILPRRVMVFKPSNVRRRGSTAAAPVQPAPKARNSGQGRRPGLAFSRASTDTGAATGRPTMIRPARHAERGDGEGPEAFRTIREVAEATDLPQHVLRFWETRFPQIRPLKRARGRRYYRPEDVERLKLIRRLLYDEGYTIKGVQKLFKEQGVQNVGSAVLDARLPFALAFSFAADEQEEESLHPAPAVESERLSAPVDRAAVGAVCAAPVGRRDRGASRRAGRNPRGPADPRTGPFAAGVIAVRRGRHCQRRPRRL